MCSAHVLQSMPRSESPRLLHFVSDSVAVHIVLYSIEIIWFTFNLILCVIIYWTIHPQHLLIILVTTFLQSLSMSQRIKRYIFLLIQNCCAGDGVQMFSPTTFPRTKFSSKTCLSWRFPRKNDEIADSYSNNKHRFLTLI